MSSNSKYSVLGALALGCGLANASDAYQPKFIDHGHSLAESTYLIEIKQGSELSRKASAYQDGGYETAQGTWVNFKPWYSTNWTDASFTWMTQMTPNLGIIWGAGTGEKGAKYVISPSLKMGLVFQTPITKDSYLSLKATTIFGGLLKEKSCIADYGDIGGVQEVNCRLAASLLEPTQTLQYLMNDKPYNKHTLSIRFTMFF